MNGLPPQIAPPQIAQPQIAHGGQHVQGVTLGLIVPKTTHPKIWGDFANAQSWQFPVRLRCVENFTYDNIYTTAHNLIADGCMAIAFNDRTLAPVQQKLSSDLGVPVVSSVLYQYSMIQAILPPHKKIALITIGPMEGTDTHLQSVGIDNNTPVIQLNPDIFYGQSLDTLLAVQHILSAVDNTIKTLPNMGAVLLHCNSLSPYAHAVHHHTGLPVYDIYTLINWFGSSLHPTYFGIDSPIAPPAKV